MGTNYKEVSFELEGHFKPSINAIVAFLITMAICTGAMIALSSAASTNPQSAFISSNFLGVVSTLLAVAISYLTARNTRKALIARQLAQVIGREYLSVSQSSRYLAENTTASFDNFHFNAMDPQVEVAIDVHALPKKIDSKIYTYLLVITRHEE